MKKRFVFLKEKMVCIVIGYIEIIIVVGLSVVMAIYTRSLLGILVSIGLMIIGLRRLIVARKGCLQIIKILNEYKLTMCKGVPRKRDGEVFKVFLKSFQDIFDDNTIKKLNGKEIYINTHGKFCRGILRLLSDNKVYYKEQLDALAEKGSINIKGHKILIKKLKDRKNLMLASAYPIWPSEEQLDEFEEKNHAEKFYELCIPIELFEQMNLKNKICRKA